MTSDEQLQLWVDGESKHNYDRCKPEGECCPDFSCCVEKVNTPIEVRKKFQASDDKTRLGMLGMFLGGAITLEFPNKEIYISGDANETSK